MIIIVDDVSIYVSRCSTSFFWQFGIPICILIRNNCTYCSLLLPLLLLQGIAKIPQTLYHFLYLEGSPFNSTENTLTNTFIHPHTFTRQHAFQHGTEWSLLILSLTETSVSAVKFNDNNNNTTSNRKDALCYTTATLPSCGRKNTVQWYCSSPHYYH